MNYPDPNNVNNITYCWNEFEDFCQEEEINLNLQEVWATWVRAIAVRREYCGCNNKGLKC